MKKYLPKLKKYDIVVTIIIEMKVKLWTTRSILLKKFRWKG